VTCHVVTQGVCHAMLTWCVCVMLLVGITILYTMQYMYILHIVYGTYTCSME